MTEHQKIETNLEVEDCVIYQSRTIFCQNKVPINAFDARSQNIDQVLEKNGRHIQRQKL